MMVFSVWEYFSVGAVKFLRFLGHNIAKHHPILTYPQPNVELARFRLELQIAKATIQS